MNRLLASCWTLFKSCRSDLIISVLWVHPSGLSNIYGLSCVLVSVLVNLKVLVEKMGVPDESAQHVILSQRTSMGHSADEAVVDLGKWVVLFVQRSV